MPLINPNFIGDECDLKAVVGAVCAMRDVISRESLVHVVEEEVEPGHQVQSDKDIGAWVRKVPTIMWHRVGTCRMGKDERAVVDARLRVRGIQGLRVIDPSIRPNITSGNTNAPTQALARHASVMFVEDYEALSRK